MPKRKNRLGAGDLILNVPFAEPDKYWSYDRKHMIFTQMDGRRPAGYIVATPDAQGFNDPGQFVELDLVNKIRPRVKAWREANYPGATGISRRLLEHWHDPNQREGMRFFFCQLEAIETLMWLTEAHESDKQGIAIPSDGGPFPRWCAKMATGSGKTIVMAMVIAWQTLNKVPYAQDARYSKHFLAIAPGLTVRNRLAVLIPYALDRSELVESWVKNDHLGFEILFVYRGVVRKYRPDFLVRLKSGIMLIVEIKGEETDETQAKHRFLAEWVDAINQTESFGKWRWTVITDPGKIDGHLQDLERELEQLKIVVASSGAKAGWLSRLTGSRKDDPVFDEIVRLGKEIYAPEFTKGVGVARNICPTSHAHR